QEFGPTQGNRNERSSGGGNYFGAWPSEWILPAMESSLSGGLAFESVEIAHEGLQMQERRGGNGAEQGVDTGGVLGLVTGGGNGDGIPMEEMSLNFEKITWVWQDGGITAEDDWETPRAIAGPGGGTMAEDDWETPVALRISFTIT